MKSVGVFGLHAMRISNLLSSMQLPNTTVTARDITSIERCPEVLVVSAQSALQTLAEVDSLRTRGYSGRIIALTSMSLTEKELTLLYQAGADNCLSGEASSELLHAIVHTSAQIRAVAANASYRGGNVVLDTRSHSVTIGGKSVNLGPSGFELLLLFFKRQGQVLARERILESFRPQKHLTVDTRLVDVYVGRLRKTLQSHGCDGLRIETIWSYGYRLDID